MLLFSSHKVESWGNFTILFPFFYQLMMFLLPSPFIFFELTSYYLLGNPYITPKSHALQVLYFVGSLQYINTVVSFLCWLFLYVMLLWGPLYLDYILCYLECSIFLRGIVFNCYKKIWHWLFYIYLSIVNCQLSICHLHFGLWGIL